MTDNVEIVEISPASDGLTNLSNEGPEPEIAEIPEPKEEKPKEKPSIEDSLKKAFDKEKTAEKPAEKPEVKAEEKPEEKPQETVAEKQQPEKAQPKEKPSEGRKFDVAPSRMLPEASAKWANVPNEVKAEVYRAFDDMEREKQEYEGSRKFHEELKEYEDMGKQYNVTVKQALDNYVNMEKVLHSNPTEGFKQVLSNMRMSPVDAISHIMAAYGVDPQKVGQHMASNPQNYAPKQAQQPSNVPNPELAEVKQELQALKQTLQRESDRKIEEQGATIINKFAEQYPDYWHLQDKIANIFSSGIIETNHGTSLSGEQKLKEAYRMAGGSMSSSRYDDQADPQPHSPAGSKRLANPDAGKLSIGGAPSGESVKTKTRKGPPPSVDEALAAAFRRVS